MDDDVKATAQSFLEAQDRLSGGPAEELCTEDYIAYMASFPPMDLQAHRAFSAGFYAGFPDLKHNIEDLVAQGDRVAGRLRLTGTNTESFMGNPPSGKTIEFEALTLMRITSGRVAELHAQFDQMGVLQQIGILTSQ